MISRSLLLSGRSGPSLAFSKCKTTYLKHGLPELSSRNAVRPLHRYHSTAAGSAALRITAASQNNNRDSSSSSSSSPLGFGTRLRNVVLTSLGAAALAATLTMSPPSISQAEAAVPTGSPIAAVPATMQSKQPMPSTNYLSAEEIATVNVFQQNTPAVVNISNIIAARTRYSMDPIKIPQGQGSGFIWDTNGHIVTNYHVIRGAAEVQVTLIDQTVWKAKIIGGDPSKDVAVLQIEAPTAVLKNLKPVAVGESSGLFVGQRVLAIGNPFGLDHSLSGGIVSGLNRELATGMGPGLRGVIQTDAAINPGNSGGPLLDSRGRLIGINTAIADPSGKGSSSGVGFAVPIDTVKGLVEQILTYGRVVRPILGVTIAPPQALRQLGLEGVLILDAPRGSPAAKAGLQGISKDNFGRIIIGDVIVGFNNKPVKSEGDLFEQLDKCKVGEKVTLDVLRQGQKKMTLSVVLGERAPEPSD
jgi:S1-C subfamily serine protease